MIMRPLIIRRLTTVRRRANLTPKINRKVVNATEVEYDGIKFRSKIEGRVYLILKDNGFVPEYETEKIILLPQLRPSHAWYLDGVPQITKKGRINIVKSKEYTPDFKLQIGNTTVYLEVKGHPNDVYPVTRKLFLRWIEEQDRSIIFSEVHSIRGLNKFMEVLKQLKNDNKQESRV